jgi:hypothetical protein
MKRTKTGLVLLGVIAAVGLTPVLAAANVPPAPTQEKPDKESQKFEGKVDSVDVKAKTLTVGGKLIYTSDTTKITKAGKAIQLAQIMDGDEVHGTTKQTLDGKTEALTVKVGKEKEDPVTPAPKY